ncbi:amidase [Actinopolymorpha singaporensis]
MAQTRAGVDRHALDPDDPGSADSLCVRIDAASELHAFVAEAGRRERVRRELAELRELREASEVAAPAGSRSGHGLDRPALFGVPVGVKDVFHVDGLPTAAGSRLPPELLAGPEGGAVTRLREAGAVVAGKTVTAEFASVAPGPTRNPHRAGHTPGGSSSGSAAAVAAGLVPLALGTQTVGSVLRPAAYCGIVGFKPGHGRIPDDGLVPNAPTFDTVGILAVDVATAIRAAAVLCTDWRPGLVADLPYEGGGTPEALPLMPFPPELPVLGVPDGAYLRQATPVAQAAFAAQVETLAAAGYPVRRVGMLDDIDEVNRRNRTINGFEFARVHEQWFAPYADRYHPLTAAAVRDGRKVSETDYADALARREHFAGDLVRRMDAEGIDGWIAPAATGPAPEGLDSTGSPLMTLPWTQARLPAVSVPAGLVDGLPVGLQCVARPGADETLLAWARRLAAVLGTTRRREGLR